MCFLVVVWGFFILSQKLKMLEIINLSLNNFNKVLMLGITNWKRKAQAAVKCVDLCIAATVTMMTAGTTTRL